MTSTRRERSNISSSSSFSAYSDVPETPETQNPSASSSDSSGTAEEILYRPFGVEHRALFPSSYVVEEQEETPVKSTGASKIKKAPKEESNPVQIKEVKKIKSQKRKKTREEQFKEVEAAMSTGISSRTVTSRVRPMVRRGGRLSVGRPRNLPPAEPVPRSRREEPSRAVQDDRVAAFRGQIEAAGAFVGTRVEAFFHLRRFNWDVDSAVTEWLLHHQSRLGGIDAEDFELELLSGDEDIENRRLRPRRTGEQERRDATNLLIERLREATGDVMITLTRYEAVGLLHHYRFDIDQAVERYVNSHGNIEEITEIYEPFRRRRPNQRQQDRRVAEYVDITGVGDWYTAWEILKRLDWDLAAALSMWQQNRVRAVRHPDREIKGWGKKQRERERRGFRLDCEGNVWQRSQEVILKHDAGKGKGKEAALFAEESEVGSGSEISDDDRDYANSRQEGAPIGPRILAKVGAPNPDLFSVELIQNGEYRRDRWNGGFRLTTPPRAEAATPTDSDEEEVESPLKGKGKGKLLEPQAEAEVPSEGAPPPQPPSVRKKGRGGSTKGRHLPRSITDFDWNNPAHVRQLNQWTNQRYSRMTMDKEADRVEWIPEEQDFLRQLHYEQKAERLRKDPKAFNKTKKMYLPEAIKNDWVQKFNDRFEGQVLEGTDGPRPHRSWGSISSQRSRLRDLCKAFDITFSEAHPMSLKRATKIKPESGEKQVYRKRAGKGAESPSKKTGRATKRNRDPKDDSDGSRSPAESRSGDSGEDEPGPSGRRRRT